MNQRESGRLDKSKVGTQLFIGKVWFVIRTQPRVAQKEDDLRFIREVCT